MTKNDFILIPKQIFKDKQISDTQILLLGIIIDDCKKNGKCTRSNRQFGDIFNIVMRSMTRHLSILKTLGYIEMKDVEIQEEDCFVVYTKLQRQIFLTEKTQNLLKGGNQ